MKDQQQLNYDRIAEVINFIKTHFKSQPSLDEMAAHIHLSPFHFQRLFTTWVGTSPKNFLQYISINHARQILQERQAGLAETAWDAGLSGPSRLHDLFIKLEGMSPAVYRNGGNNLNINYSYASSPFGKVIIASTAKGICYLSFDEDDLSGFHRLKSKYPNATFNHKLDVLQQKALSIFNHDWSKMDEIKLHLKASPFQLKVWECLLKIPTGKLSTYGSIADQIGSPKAARAVGTAIGANPVAFLIPCHRVIQSSGDFGGYMWGNTRKRAIIGWESVKSE